MRNFIFYSIKNTTDKKAVVKILAEYNINENYIDYQMSGFLKIISILRQDVRILESVAKMLSRSNYDKKFESFNKKHGILHKALNAAKKNAAAANSVGMVGVYSGQDRALDIQDKLNTQLQIFQSNPEVRRLQKKFDKLLKKNEVLYYSQFYTLKDNKTSNLGKTVVTTCVDPSMTSNNIFEVIDRMRHPAETFIKSAFIQFKELVSKLLNVSSEVEFMVINDEKKTPNAAATKVIKLNELKTDDLTHAQNRELIVIKK